MKNIIISVFIIFSFNIFYLTNSAKAQSNDNEILIGGNTSCRFSGGAFKFKKLTGAEENSFVIKQKDNDIEFTIDGDFTTGSKDENVSVHLFIPAYNIDINSLLEGQKIVTQNNDVELSLSKSNAGNDLEITNIIEDDNGNPVESTILIQLKKMKNDSVNGNIKIRFLNTISILSSDQSTEDQQEDNGKVVVTCDIKKVPVTNQNE